MSTCWAFSKCFNPFSPTGEGQVGEERWEGDIFDSTETQRFILMSLSNLLKS